MLSELTVQTSFPGLERTVYANLGVETPTVKMRQSSLRRLRRVGSTWQMASVVARSKGDAIAIKAQDLILVR